MNVTNKKMFSNGMIYLLSSVLTQLINLFLIPLYTRNLSQAEYGHYDLIISVQQLMAIAITLGVYSGMIRFFNEFEDKNNLKNTAITFSLIWGSLCIGIAYIANPWIYLKLFGQDPSAHLFIPIIVISSVLTCLNTTYSSFHAMDFKALKSSAIQFSTILTTLLFVIIFFIHFKMGIVGILLAQLCGNLSVFIFLFMMDIRNFKLMFKLEQLRKMLRYGSGLLLGDVSSWILTLSDRFLIKGYMSFSSVAIYSVGYKIGMLINPVFINPFVSVFTPFKFSVYKEVDGKEKIANMFRLYNFIGWFSVLGLSLFANIAVDLVAPVEYRAASYLVPIIALSYFLSGAIAFYSLGLHIANKIKVNSMITIFVAIINIIANLILIPWIGIYGSALSTVIAYVVANGLFYYYGSKYYKLGFGLLYPYKFLIVTAPLYGVYFFCMSYIHLIGIEILMNMILCAGYVLLSIKFNFLSQDELAGFLKHLKLRKVDKIVIRSSD
ncbi:lipopolysaccharide biosynthesis protein [Paenibacillus antarcticus]|uniref:Uncharacterized protein n=1 Tax=Paenibacillus antarcticus TaxID=253703 RepID=A0A168PTZ8_9BACL|nr:oligosaccharide flippase family protein [Paenibacillus antarcticus]OAB47074.1 hypothetical protein PBAT_08435 [Paenibacillus antarcticus]